MCRLILAKYSDIIRYDKENDLLRLLNFLENQCGGHGNGIAITRKDETIFHKKGVSYGNQEIINDIYSHKGDYVIYHTRIKSVGATNNKNCHPFVIRDLTLAMNGTITDLRTLGDAVGCTDTEIIARMIAEKSQKLNDVVNVVSEFDAVFVGTWQGRPFLSRGYGDLKKWGKGAVWASDFPNDTRSIQKLKYGYCYIDGDVTTRRPLDSDYYGLPPRVTTKRKAEPVKESFALSTYIHTTQDNDDALDLTDYYTKRAYDAGFEDGYNKGMVDQYGNF